MIKNLIYIIVALFCFALSKAQNTQGGRLEGLVNIDSTWSNKIYLSYLPSFEDMYTMSSEMIIAESDIDKNGNFQIDLELLPKEDKLYRLHIPKKSDSKYSLMIGLKNNYLLLIANKNSVIKLSSASELYPFDHIEFTKDEPNKAFHTVTDLILKRDSISSESDYYKRKFINEKAKQDLLRIADTSSYQLVSLYAVFQSDFDDDFVKNNAFYNSYLEKWEASNNEYIKNLRTKAADSNSQSNILIQILAYFMIFVFGIIFGKFLPWGKRKINKLSVQERKILDELKLGKSNKEISEEFNIGISTVKSHVSSILSKMNVKSRKQLME